MQGYLKEVFIMKKRLLFMVMTMISVMAMLSVSARALSPTESDNALYWYDLPLSHLYEENGNFVRVEPIDGKTIVEYYNSEFEIQSKKTITFELNIWGGFYAGEDYNFLIYGQENPDENDDVEVIRVVKYDKNWNRISHASLCGANTTIPFDAGSLRCAEYGGYLYIRTCHEIYMTEDGLNHQTNMSFTVKEDSMEIVDANYLVQDSNAGYVAHSFNQFIMIDSDRNIIALDEGDGFPRALVMNRYSDKAGNPPTEDDYEEATEVFIQGFIGEIGDNATGSKSYGIAETTTGYITAYLYDGAGENYRNGNLYLNYISKNNFPDNSSKKYYRLTNYSSDDDIEIELSKLVSTGLNGGYIMWNEQDEDNDIYFYYAKYSSDGSVSDIKKAKGVYLSDCQPICVDREVIWYATDDSEPVFYQLSDSGLTADSKKITVKNIGSESIKRIPNDEVIFQTGKCGDNIEYKLDANLTLTLSGYGDMYDDISEDEKWYEVVGEAESVVFDDRITSIPDWAFNVWSSKIKNIKLPAKLISIGAYAFGDCELLETISFPDSLTSIGDRAFRDCDLKDVIIPSTVTSIGAYAFYSNNRIFFDGTQAQLENAYGDNEIDSCVYCLAKTGDAEISVRESGSSVKVTATRTSDKRMRPTVILATYNNGKLVDVQKQDSYLTASTYTNTFSAAITDDVTSYKVFLWDASSLMRPITEVYSKDI